MSTRRRFAVAVTVVAILFFLGIGLWAFFSPRSFFDELATHPPYNAHFIHDLGAFQIGLGAVLALTLAMRPGLQAALLGVGIGSAFHVAAHVMDDEAGFGSSDAWLLGLLTALILAAAWAVGTARDEAG